MCVGQTEPKFTVLFPKDGPVTTGWVVRTWANVKDAPEWETIWQVWDGILYGGKSPTHKWVGTWLLSEREYGDFILEVDFKFINGGATGNGGVALRAPLAGRPSYHGMELQITDPRYEFSLYRYGGSDQLTGAIYKVLPPIKQVYNAGEWNHYRIDLRGPLLKVWLNDVLIQDANLDTVTQKVIPHEDWKEAGAAAVPTSAPGAYWFSGTQRTGGTVALPQCTDRGTELRRATAPFLVTALLTSWVARVGAVLVLVFVLWFGR